MDGEFQPPGDGGDGGERGERGDGRLGQGASRRDGGTRAVAVAALVLTALTVLMAAVTAWQLLT